LIVLTQLKNREVEDILIVCIDGVSGYLEAIVAVYPKKNSSVLINGFAPL